MKLIHLFLLLLSVSIARAGNNLIENTPSDSTSEKKGKITINGYIDAYYGYSFNKIDNNTIPFFVSSARHNEININLVFLDLQYEGKNVRARIIPGFGTYMQANYSLEPTGLNRLVEGSAGFRVFPKKNIWLDAGVLNAPFTNENAVSKDHLVYSRTIAADFSPYFMGGVKLSIPFPDKVTLYLYLINGWQLITDNNPQKSIAAQFEIKANEKNLYNFNLYGGNERSLLTPDFRHRFFVDFSWVRSGKKFSSTFNTYYGLQETGPANNIISRYWWQVNTSLKYQLNTLFSVAGRVEYFSDINNTVVAALNNQTGIDCFGTTVSFAYHFSDNGMFRMEARNIFSKQYLFNDHSNNPTNYFNWVLSSIAVWF